MGTVCSTTQIANVSSTSITNGTVKKTSENRLLKSKVKLSSIFALSEYTCSESEDEVDLPATPIRTATSCVKSIEDFPSLKNQAISDYLPSFKQLITGQIDKPLLEAVERQVITVCHISHYTDCEAELETIRYLVYRKIKEKCSKLGVQLQVVNIPPHSKRHTIQTDGIHYITADLLEHFTSHKHVIYTIFLNDLYGIFWCPKAIEKNCFEDILKKCTENDRNFITSKYCFVSSLNCYVLQHSDIPKHKNTETCEVNVNERRKQEIRLRNIFSYAASLDSGKPFHSDLDEAIRLLLKETRGENVIWLNRRFTGRTWDEHIEDSPILENYVDISNKFINEIAKMKLAKLYDVLNASIIPGNQLCFDVKWSNTGIDGAIDEHRKYLQLLSEGYEKALCPYIDDMLTRVQTLRQTTIKMKSKGVSKCLQSVLLDQCVQLLDVQSNAVGMTNVLRTIEDWLLDQSAPPIVLHGSTGSGKTTLSAVVANNVFTLNNSWRHGYCIYRSAGSSRELISIEQLLASLVEQISLLTNQPLHNQLLNSEESFQYLLSTWTTEFPSGQKLLIIIDGLDQYETITSNISWLPNQTMHNVYILVTVTSNASSFDALQTHLNTSKFIEIPQLETVELVSVFETCLGKPSESWSKGFHDKLQKQLQQYCTPLTVKLMATVCKLRCRIAMNNMELGCNTNELLVEMLQLLEFKYGTSYIICILGLLAVTEYGFAEEDIIKILKFPCFDDVPFLQDIHPINDYIIYEVLILCGPFLQQTICYGVSLYKWKHVCFKTSILNIYKDHIFYINKLTSNYFSQSYSSGRNFECRFLDEAISSWHKARDYHKIHIVLQDVHFLSTKIAKSGVNHLLLDLKKMLHLNQDALIRETVIFLEKLFPVLKTNETMFVDHAKLFLKHNAQEYKQLRASWMAVLDDFTDKNLQLYDTKVKYYFGYRPSRPSDHCISKLYRVPHHPYHVIALSEACNIITVINIESGESERTLKDIHKPRDLRFITAYQAIVLCDRELRMYDLNLCLHISTMKGVLNLQLPYFGVHSQHYTMAVSRNRMYVNMFHNSSGDVETTFKIGEDRFINSLLVSDNGEKCVCGDDVLKPSPLLVWDLNNRQLIHDLRIAGHQFITQIACLSPDGKYIVCASKELENPDPNVLLIYELNSGRMYTKLKPEYSCTAVCISPCCTSVVSAHHNGDILVWNLNDCVGNIPRFALKGHCVGIDSIYLSETGNRALTFDSTGRDTSIFLWDLTEGLMLGYVKSLCAASCCQISADGQFVVIAYPNYNDVITMCVARETVAHITPQYYGEIQLKGKITSMPEKSD